MQIRITGTVPTERAEAGFFSHVTSFSLPPGQFVGENSIRGYYIDLRVKCKAPTWPPSGMPPLEQRLHVAMIQWALGCYEHYIAGEGDAWLAAACDCAEEILAAQETAGPLAGGWAHMQAFPHTFRLRPPWLSAMGQGEGASLMVRLFAETREQRYAESARRALLPLDADAPGGGVCASLDGGTFPEEYPTSPPSFVLNGGIFAMWGLHDVGVGLEDSRALATFEQAVDTLAANLHRWDLGFWSRYDLFPHPVPNVASSFYHDLHVTQLRMIDRLAPRPALADMAERWAANLSSPLDRQRAFAGKALFRMVVPRNRTLARHLPWSALRGQEKVSIVRGNRARPT